MRMILAPLAALAVGCAAIEETRPMVRFAHLGRAGGDAAGFAELRASFRAANPGYDVAWHANWTELAAGDAPLVAFVQAGEASVTVAGDTSDPPLACGDVLLLRPGEVARSSGDIAALVFHVPVDLPRELPPFVRPDWDPGITDTPGGCAEETGAYRRILLTWLNDNGPYVYHALNAHRVRIQDSFSHYHPLEGGFDEFYLVQMVQEEARLITSDRTARIESPEDVTREEATQLLEVHPLAVGDLVYLPRGTVHRGLGGVLAQVITTPGFRPGAEIGVDHRLHAINERLGLEGSDMLPLHAANAQRAVVK
ncbi:MAG: hypothetical protein GY711_34360 [bacterium]|nr:hypothetical protein [bacterium]